MTEFCVSSSPRIYDTLRLVAGLKQIFHKNKAQWETHLCSRTFLKIFGSHCLFFSINFKRFVKIEVESIQYWTPRKPGEHLISQLLTFIYLEVDITLVQYIARNILQIIGINLLYISSKYFRKSESSVFFSASNFSLFTFSALFFTP